MKKNIWLGITVCILFLAVIIVPVSYSWTGKEKVDISVDILKVEYVDGMSTITGNVRNQTDQDIDISSFSLILFEQNKEIFREPLYVASILKKGESKSFQVQVTEDASMVTDASYQLVK